MTTKILRKPEHVALLAERLAARKFPITVTWTQGASRSDAQNKLSHRWYADIARQLGDQTTEEVRAECKRAHGVPILLAANDAFAVSWDRVMGRLTYEEQVRAVQAFDLPVTRLMTVPQMTAYMEAVQREYAGQGVRLTDPEALKYELEFA
jgi:hypothetical protein